MSDLTKEQLEDWRREICPENGWTGEFRELRKIVDMALASLDLRGRLAQAERERDTALYDAKGCAKASLMIAGDFAKAEARAERLEAALRKIASRGPVFDAKGTWSREVCEIAREALASSPSSRAEARQDGTLDPELPETPKD